MSWILDNINKVHDLDNRIKIMEEQFTEFAYSTLQAVQSQLKKNWVTSSQSSAYYGLRIGLCVDTKDPFGEGRIRYYLASKDNKNTPIEKLPWAKPISALGGFDDSGALWVPPAGSAVALLHEVGDRESAFYLGTVWNRNRGIPPHNWGYQVPEYECIHQGHRDGYWVGKNDESQVLPPDNTYNYNIKDFDDLKAFEQNTEALKKITPSHVNILKTNQKHYLRFDDGNYFCNHKYKHVELGSSTGNRFLMWDDHMNRPGSHAHPKACEPGPNANGGNGGGIECGQGESEDFSQMCRSEDPNNCKTSTDELCQNDLMKHESNARLWRGPGTPQNNKCDLQQTGNFLSSVSGQVFSQHDEVEQPQGIPNWERGTESFDFGCTDKYLGKTQIISGTGHIFHMGDAEDQSGVRSGTFTHPVTGRYEPNGILLQTATGHRIEANDHTLSNGTAGERRFIQIESTAKHLLEFVDYTNEQQSPNRMEGGEPVANAKQAYARLKSGYGLQLLFRDDNSQEETQNQFIELLAPHKDNCHGPHILRMQERPDDAPGFILLRCGGYFYGLSMNDWIEVVGCNPQDDTQCCVPASKVTVVSENDIHQTEDSYVYISDIEFHHAKQFIVLAAGEDCEDDNPCVYPVIVGKCPWTCPWTGYTHFGVESMSERVFASADNECN